MVVSVATSSAAASTAPAVIFTPRHAHLPDIGLDNNVLFEALIFIYSAMVLGLQYVNLYKTVWWLPHSSANYALVTVLISCF
jgi:Putative transmembrane protein